MVIFIKLFYFIIINISNQNNKNKIKQSELYPEIIEITNEAKESFLYNSTLIIYEQMIEQLNSIGSYYISKFEENNTSDNEIDKVKTIEKLLKYQFLYLNSKRKLINGLFEVFEHTSENKEIIETIENIIDEEPNLNLPIYNFFEAPFKLSIELMEKRAETIQLLINSQILNEREIATTIGDKVPLFDRPHLIGTKCITKYRIFGESFPITVFEVYESLAKIIKCFKIIPNVSLGICELANIKEFKYITYVELGIFKEVISLISNSILHLPYNFNFKLSDSVNSLFISNYSNSYESLENLIIETNEQQKSKLILSFERFLHLSNYLKELIIETDQLQKAYFEQCDFNGIEHKNVHLRSFKEEIQGDSLNEFQDSNILDFALSKFEYTNANFCEICFVKEIISKNDFLLIQKLSIISKLLLNNLKILAN